MSRNIRCNYFRWHPHIHELVAAGLFSGNSVCRVMPDIEVKPIAKPSRAEVLKMTKMEGCVNDGPSTKIIDWRHNSNLSVHNRVRITAGDE